MAGQKLVLPFITRLKLLFYAVAARILFRSDATINRGLHDFFDFKSRAPATKIVTTTTRVSTSDVHVDPTRNLWFRLFVPNTDKPLPFVLYFHGGGFATFGPASIPFDYLCTRLAAQIPAVVASVNYRLAPEHRYPSQYDDSFDALKFIDSQNYAVLPANTNLGKCIIAGDSAGANIAHHVILSARKSSDEFENVKIVGLVSAMPFFGGEERTKSEKALKNAPMLNVKMTDWMWRSFLPKGADRNHHAANVFEDHTIENVECPRTLVVMGGYDPLQDWQMRYVEWMRKCGKDVELIEYPNAFHAFYMFPEVPEFDVFVDDVKEFVNKGMILV